VDYIEIDDAVEYLAPHLNPNWLYRKYWIEGESTCEISRKAGVTAGAIQYLMVRFHIPRRIAFGEKLEY